MNVKDYGYKTGWSSLDRKRVKMKHLDICWQSSFFYEPWFLFFSHIKTNAVTRLDFFSLPRGEVRWLLRWSIIRYHSQRRKWWCWWLSRRHFLPRRDVRRGLQSWKCCFSLRCKVEILISWNIAVCLDCSLRDSQ